MHTGIPKNAFSEFTGVMAEIFIGTVPLKMNDGKQGLRDMVSQYITDKIVNTKK